MKISLEQKRGGVRIKANDYVAEKQKCHCHRKVKDSIVNGELKRPEKCPKCEKICRPSAHHEDYTKPLDVIWLCNKCHRIWHSKFKGIFIK